MDDEAITWNLKGPKRMKKRRELNALIRNNSKYRSLPNKTTSGNSVDRFNFSDPMTTRSKQAGASRLLNNDNDTSSDNESYYFSANKTMIREYFKLINHIMILTKIIA